MRNEEPLLSRPLQASLLYKVKRQFPAPPSPPTTRPRVCSQSQYSFARLPCLRSLRSRESVRRNQNTAGKAAAGWVGSGNLPRVTRRRVRGCSGHRRHERATLDPVPESDANCLYRNVPWAVHQWNPISLPTLLLRPASLSSRATPCRAMVRIRTDFNLQSI